MLRTLLILLSAIPIVYIGVCCLRFVQLVRLTILLHEEAVWEKACTDI
jgi:hypothetical protein